jgi:hypothetical protein
MADELPSGDRAVYIFLEMIALGFVLTAIDTVVNGKAPIVWLSCFVLSIIFFLAGIKWPQIKQVLGEQFSDTVEWAASYRALAVLGVAAYVAITQYEPRYRYTAVTLGAGYFMLSGVAYVRSLRRDLDRYVMPRQVTTRQVKKLRTYLSRHDKYPITVKVNPQDHEALEYANAIIQGFNQTGWKAELNIAPPYTAAANDGLGIHATGVNSVAYESKNDPRPILQEAFRFAGIEANHNSGVGAGDFNVSILVGHRPLRIGHEESILTKLGRFMQRLG